jgi:hypothetical protein
VIDSYLQRLSDIDPDWERSWAVLQPHTIICTRGGIRYWKQPIILIFKINLKHFQLIQRRQKVIQSTMPIYRQDIPLVSNANIFIFYYRINVISVHVYSTYAENI